MIIRDNEHFFKNLDYIEIIVIHREHLDKASVIYTDKCIYHVGGFYVEHIELYHEDVDKIIGYGKLSSISDLTKINDDLYVNLSYNPRTCYWADLWRVRSSNTHGPMLELIGFQTTTHLKNVVVPINSDLLEKVMNDKEISTTISTKIMDYIKKIKEFYDSVPSEFKIIN